jgi:hypothetical protein
MSFMFESIIFTFAVLIFAIAGLAIGVFFKRPALRGSCGGIACVESAKCVGCPHASGDIK